VIVSISKSILEIILELEFMKSYSSKSVIN